MEVSRTRETVAAAGIGKEVVIKTEKQIFPLQISMWVLQVQASKTTQIRQ